MEKIAQGAEATIYLDKDIIIKERLPKKYRIKEIDEKLRKRRTRKEAKVLGSLPIPGPKLIKIDDKAMVIEMEYLKGTVLSSCLEKMDYMAISKEIGQSMRKLHDATIIHGDPTTSNMIYSDKVYFIDFGLSFTSIKTEDKAVDLHLLSQALESKHYKIAKKCFKAVTEAYSDKKVLKRLLKVEARGRNKAK